MGVIYCARNKVNGKRYIGQTTQTLEKRRAQHENGSRMSKFRYCSLLIAAIKKYGVENFEWSVLDSDVPDDLLDALEIDTIAIYNTVSPGGYNISTGGFGGRLSEETKRKIGEAGRNRPPISEETRQRLSAAKKGTKHSNETKKKLSEISKNMSEEHKRKISEACKNPSAEIRAKISEAGRNRVVSEETRRKMSSTRTGRKLTPMADETKQKLSIAFKGKPLSEEHKRKIGEACKNPSPEARKRMSDSRKAYLEKKRLQQEISD